MTIDIPEEAAEQLKKLAEEENVPPADMVAALIAAEIARREFRK